MKINIETHLIILWLVHIPFSCNSALKTESYNNSDMPSSYKNDVRYNNVIYLLTADIAELKADRRDNILIYTGMLLASALGLGLFVYKRVSISESKRKILENETKILKTKIHDKSFDEVIALAKKNDTVFFTKFTALYPDFVPGLQKINPDLKRSELMFCAMLKLNFSSKEIANITGVLHTSVQKRKNKIRKRLNIPSEADLYFFFDQLG
ncbi:helix-turn-helix transcriptional regulator [Elizabethkingia occulta]|uniref:helix-turn-helix transcriptional regulator n=2 Tax=Elizabethkingia occulta TaxID=1867263 RepID=UPI00398C381A